MTLLPGRRLRGAIGFLLLAGASSGAAAQEWPVAGGDAGNTRYSALRQIHRGNVGRLRVAWTYRTGDLPPDGRGEIQATPIVVDGILYTTTPALAVIALRAETGTLMWRFEPFARGERAGHVNRGVVYWSDGNDRRILFTAGRRIYALDAGNGTPIPSFGASGSVDLAAGLSREIGEAYLVATSPGAIYGDLLIQGTRVGEDEGSAPGDIRAYDVRTGAVRWVFHTIPQPGEHGFETWPTDAWKTAGGANSWAGMSVDTARGIVYVPTGSATPDFYGGGRVGANLFANSLIALDARTGKRIWHFQTVHHDIWDRDLPAAPNLVTVVRGAAPVEAVAQIAKSGFVFLFDRVTGAPLFDIEERPVPASTLSGEQAWPTQPFPAKPAPFARQSMAEDDLTDLTSGARAAAQSRFRMLRSDGLFAPPSLEGTIVLPGFDGGGEWGGAAVDPATATLFVSASDVPWIAAMRESAKLGRMGARPRTGAVVYAETCAACHGADRLGRPPAPSLVGVVERSSAARSRMVLEWGRGFMPSFAGLHEAERDAVLEYLGYSSAELSQAPRRNQGSTRAKSPYEFVAYERWRDSAGFPAIRPPWGTLSAIDLNTGEYKWRVALGEHDSLEAPGMSATGTELYGGPIVTAGDLVFIAATQDSKFRALDASSGRVLWEARLPAPGYATPATYSVRGQQYIVIAAGGGKLGSPSSDTYVAFALP